MSDAPRTQSERVDAVARVIYSELTAVSDFEVYPPGEIPWENAAAHIRADTSAVAEKVLGVLDGA